MISKKLKDEIWDYCRINDITDVDKFIERMTQQGYYVEKYGTSPTETTIEVKEVEKIVEVEKVVEVIKEVPVEVIKEVEKIVEKNVYITDDEVTNKLMVEVDNLKKELDVEKTKKNRIKQDSTEYIREINELKDKINDLTKELIEEKKKPKSEKKEITLPNTVNRKSSINWIPKTDREKDDLYGD